MDTPMILFCKVKHSCQWELRRDGWFDSYREKKSGTKTHEEKSLSISVLARGRFIRFASAADFQVLITPDQGCLQLSLERKFEAGKVGQGESKEICDSDQKLRGSNKGIPFPQAT